MSENVDHCSRCIKLAISNPRAPYHQFGETSEIQIMIVVERGSKSDRNHARNKY